MHVKIIQLKTRDASLNFYEPRSVAFFRNEKKYLNLQYLVKFNKYIISIIYIKLGEILNEIELYPFVFKFTEKSKLPPMSNFVIKSKGDNTNLA